MRLGSGMRLTPLAGFRRVLGYSRRGACGMVASVCVLGMHIKLKQAASEDPGIAGGRTQITWKILRPRNLTAS
jgi:hypothetical protein